MWVVGGHKQRFANFQAPGAALDWFVCREFGEESAGFIFMSELSSFLQSSSNIARQATRAMQLTYPSKTPSSLCNLGSVRVYL